MVAVKLKSEDACVNAFHIEIEFPVQKLKLVDFSTGRSIISLWIEKPDKNDIAAANLSGQLIFEGGVPGGYCPGRAAAFDQAGILAELAFRSPATIVEDPDGINGAFKININKTSKIHQNDGTGALLEFQTKDSFFEISTSTHAGGRQWSEFLKNDTISPEQFEIKINQDDLFEDGKYFATFQSSDKQSGIDRYEASETPLANPSAKDNWKPAASPYVLEDQALRSKIKVKAIDLAGNETVSEYLPRIPADGKKTTMALLAAIMAIAIALTLVALNRIGNDKK